MNCTQVKILKKPFSRLRTLSAHPSQLEIGVLRAEVRPPRTLRLPFRPVSGLPAPLGRNPMPGTEEAPEGPGAGGRPIAERGDYSFAALLCDRVPSSGQIP